MSERFGLWRTRKVGSDNPSWYLHNQFNWLLRQNTSWTDGGGGKGGGGQKESGGLENGVIHNLLCVLWCYMLCMIWCVLCNLLCGGRHCISLYCVVQDCCTPILLCYSIVSYFSVHCVMCYRVRVSSRVLWSRLCSVLHDMWRGRVQYVCNSGLKCGAGWNLSGTKLNHKMLHREIRPSETTSDFSPLDHLLN